jgi:putative peptidoglycan lipid II flippase
MATVGVNLISMIALLIVLDRKINGLPWRNWGMPILGLFFGSLLAGVGCWGALQACERVMGKEGFVVQVIELAIASTIGLGLFALLAMQLKLPEVDLFVNRLRQKFRRY